MGNAIHNVKAVGAILINKEGKILLQKRDLSAPTSPGKVSPFGGQVESGETVLEALTRELLEELELSIDNNGSKPKLIYEKNSLREPNKKLQIYLITDVDDSKLVLHEGEKIVKLSSFSELIEIDKSGILKNFDPRGIIELQ